MLSSFSSKFSVALLIIKIQECSMNAESGLSMLTHEAKA